MKNQSKTTKQSAGWCFTVNNPKMDAPTLLALLKPKAKYAVFQLEAGEDGTPHFQGYIKLLRTQRLSYLKKILPRAHWEIAIAGDIANTAYCTKPEGRISGPHVIGKPIKRRQRTDLQDLADRARATETLSSIVADCNNYTQIRFVEKLVSYRPISHDYKPKTVHWLYGSTGCGKTKKAMLKCPEGDTYHATTGQWFNGYEGQGHVIIDELRAKNWSYDLMLRLLDGYDLRVPNKGGFTIWTPHTIWITTPLDPQATYAGTLKYHGSIEQLLRRVTNIVECEKEGTIFKYTKIN